LDWLRCGWQAEQGDRAFNQKVVVGTARLLFAVLTEQLFGSFHDWHSKFFSSLQ